MSDVMRIQPFATQLRRIVSEYRHRRSIFDIPASLFHVPDPRAPYVSPDVFGRRLAAPVGPSAGPHTQLSQNIVSAFLCGGRFMELKTVQARDDLVVPRPCIDMTDEGYNVEWSQELRLDESVHEYVAAWALVHVLPRLLGWEAAGHTPDGPGVVFDLSVGYDLAGITAAPMQRIVDQMVDASQTLAGIRATLARDFPDFADVAIPDAVTNSVTLSTMHGCPPEEVERIARFLMRERGLHTVVKLNPTLIGKAAVLDVLHGALGFTEIDIPDRVFEHDLRFDAAADLIRRLQDDARRAGVAFGVKLSNTLAMRNHTGRLPGDEVYMSGRALYPITMQLFARLVDAFDGALRVSFSGGADATNVASVAACGAVPVTGCTDLLKPGGYARLGQWLSNLRAAMDAAGAGSLDAFAADRRAAVQREAAAALKAPRYKKTAFRHGSPKVASALGAWDCVVAPCVEACAVEQDVPDYAWLIAQGDYDGALAVILARNPLPGITGYVCTALCETRCTRNDYEETVAIRDLKRLAEEHGRADYRRRPPTGHRVAIVGGGPSGLAAAAFLALQGLAVTIFEARQELGGMLRTIPAFRLPDAIVQRDIDRILGLGVAVRFGARLEGPPEHLLADGFDAVYLAAGFQRDAPLCVPGVDGPGVVPALEVLARARRGDAIDLGRRAVVIGGGDTAMDAARTARRLTGAPVAILYRRSRLEMPAAYEEIEAALAEGIELHELVAPVEVVREQGAVTGVRCVRTALGPAGADGRRSPIPVAGSAFVVACDAVVVAVGQLPDLAFLDGSGIVRHPSGGVVVEEASGCAGPDRVYAGGDVVVEPGSIISACADGRRAAEAICRRLGVPFDEPARPRPVLTRGDVDDVRRIRALRIDAEQPAVLPMAARGRASVVEATLTAEQGRREGLRCVQCTTVCDKCVEVCPNRANYAFDMVPVVWDLPVIGDVSGAAGVVGHETFRIVQNRQILHVDDFCNECDNCQTFCVHQGRPYHDKPRLFLDAALFDGDARDACRIDGAAIVGRFGGHLCRLTTDADGRVFEEAGLRVRVDAAWRVLSVEAAGPLETPRSLRRAAELAVVYDGVARELPFLLVR